jgi:hypothetical protein
LTIMSRARLLVVGALPIGLTLTVATSARHLQADVFAFVVVSYLGVSTLSVHGLLQLEDQETKRHAAEGRDPMDGDTPSARAMALITTDERVVDFAAASRRNRQRRRSHISAP